MTVKIKKITYLLPPRDIFNDALDVFVSLEDDYCTEEFRYFVEVTTPQFLSTILEKGKNGFLLPDYPFIIVSKLTDDVVRAAIESFVNSEEDARWIKLYHIMPKLNTEEINEILYRKKQEEIEEAIEFGLDFEDE